MLDSFHQIFNRKTFVFNARLVKKQFFVTEYRKYYCPEFAKKNDSSRHSLYYFSVTTG